MTDPVDPQAPSVTVELDSGPLTMKFGYVPVGRPHFSDVPASIGFFDTDQEATLAGARMLVLGNWDSFIVEKRYAVVTS